MITNARQLFDVFTSDQTLKDSDTAAFATASLRMYMADALGDDERLCKALIPEFPVGCRRLTPGTGYLESLRAPNVRLVTDGISGVVPQGIQTTGGEIIELDIIVCATGFDVSFCPRFPIVGRQGNLQDIWSTCRPRAYMSCAVPGLPNYFCETPYQLLPFQTHLNILMTILFFFHRFPRT